MKQFSVKQLGLILLVVFLFLSGVSVVFAAGELDTSFNVTTSAPGFNQTVNIIKKQPDGKYLVGGKFISVNGIAAAGLVRLNADFTVDASFNPYEFTDLNYTAAVVGLGLQSDGKIIVVTSVPLMPSWVRRILPDGTLDPTFRQFNMGYQSAIEVEILAGDKILVGGQLFNADGTPDNSFPGLISGGAATTFQPDGKILAGYGVFRRYNADGSLDNSYQIVNTNGLVHTIAYLPNEKALIGGNFSTVNGFSVGKIARINADGTPDLTFNQNLAGFNGTVKDIVVKPDGKILIAGEFSSYNSVARTRLAQLNSDGTLDNSFQPPDLSNSVSANDIEILSNGKLLVGFSADASPDPLIVLNADGTADAPLNLFFGLGGVSRFLQQPDGRILVFGGFSNINGIARSRAARLNLDGSFDASFVPDLPAFPLGISAVALQTDGKILVGGGSVLVRLNADGSRDLSFSVNLPAQDILSKIALQPDGKILAQGSLTYQFFRFPRVLRYNANGSLDTTFNVPQTSDAILAFALQPDGKIVVGGAFGTINSVQRLRIARLNADGTLDAAFSPPGGANDLVLDMQLQADGKIVLGGRFTGLNGSTNQNRIGRLNADGSLDNSFVQPLSINDTAVSFKLQPDGKIIVWGSFDAVGATPKTGIVRFNANGSIDPTFNPTVNKAASPDRPISDVYLQADGKILIGGGFTRVNGVSRSGIARLHNNLVTRSAPFDYDGDGKADVSVFRPSENKWYILQSSNNSVVQTIFAAAGDIPVPADYDGDGKADVAVFRPSSGTWWYLSSINGAPVYFNWGQPGDLPRPSDFDGDGKTDFIVYRPTNSVWYRHGSTGATSFTAFGIAEDKPLVGDFDGDGKSDLAVFRPSTGDWWYAASAWGGQFIPVHWGQAGDIPVPGDYDADGKTDFVVYRPSNGGWYILRSGEQNYTILQFGTAEDKPVGADFDGDGKADVAVFRPSTGTWYLLQTTSGFGAIQWGTSGDVPTENAFLP